MDKRKKNAMVDQLVDYNLAKVEVPGSSPGHCSMENCKNCNKPFDIDFLNENGLCINCVMDTLHDEINMPSLKGTHSGSTAPRLHKLPNWIK